MGEQAEMAMEGHICQWCGEMFNDGVSGFPRLCEACVKDAEAEGYTISSLGVIMKDPAEEGRATAARASWWTVVGVDGFGERVVVETEAEGPRDAERAVASRFVDRGPIVIGAVLAGRRGETRTITDADVRVGADGLVFTDPAA